MVVGGGTFLREMGTLGMRRPRVALPYLRNGVGGPGLYFFWRGTAERAVCREPIHPWAYGAS